MKDLPQLLKWTLPGWTFLAMMFLWLFIVSLAIKPCDESLIGDFYTFLDGIKSHTGPFLLIISAGPPIGFLLYQVYFFLKEAFFNSTYTVSPEDVFSEGQLDEIRTRYGIEELLRKETRRTTLQKLFSEEWKWASPGLNQFRQDVDKWMHDKASDAYMWAFIKKIWLHGVAQKDECEVVTNRMRFLNDIHEAVGATWLAIFLSGLIVFCFALFDALKQANGSISTWQWLVFMFILVLLLLASLSVTKFRIPSRFKRPGYVRLIVRVVLGLLVLLSLVSISLDLLWFFIVALGIAVTSYWVLHTNRVHIRRRIFALLRYYFVEKEKGENEKQSIRESRLTRAQFLLNDHSFARIQQQGTMGNSGNGIRNSRTWRVPAVHATADPGLRSGSVCRWPTAVGRPLVEPRDG